MDRDIWVISTVGVEVVEVGVVVGVAETIPCLIITPPLTPTLPAPCCGERSKAISERSKLGEVITLGEGEGGGDRQSLTMMMIHLRIIPTTPVTPPPPPLLLPLCRLIPSTLPNRLPPLFVTVNWPCAGIYMPILASRCIIIKRGRLPT